MTWGIFLKTNLDRLPPQSIELEEAILSSCIFDKNNIEEAIDLLIPEDFYRTAHGTIFRAMTRMYRSQSPIDAATLMQYLSETGELETIGGAIFISRLLDIPPAIDFDYYVKKVREKAALRSTIEVCNAITKRCFDDSGDAESTIDFFQKRANEISLYGGQGDLFRVRDLVIPATDRYQELF